MIASRITEDGLEISLHEMIFNVRLCVGVSEEMVYDRAFCYPKDRLPEALIAWYQWDGEGDPPGPWIKESGTDRYRIPGVGQEA